MHTRSPPSVDQQRPLPEHERAQPALSVLSDRWLVPRITAFQCGLPLVLYAFWCEQDVMTTPRHLSRRDMDQLMETIVASGTPYHLELLQKSTFVDHNECCSPRMSRAISLAVQTNRHDLLVWLFNKNLPVEDPRALWKLAIDRVKDGDCGVVHLLLTHAPLSARAISRMLRMLCDMPDLGLLRWLVDTLPDVVLPDELTILAAQSGDLAALRFVLSHHTNVACRPEAFWAARECGHFEVLEYLISYHIEAMDHIYLAWFVMDDDPHVQQLARRRLAIFQDCLFTYLTRCAHGDSPRKLVRLAKNELLGECQPISLDRAAEWQGVVALTFLHSHNPTLATATTEAIDYAAERGRWDVVEFLFHNRTEGYTA